MKHSLGYWIVFMIISFIVYVGVVILLLFIATGLYQWFYDTHIELRYVIFSGIVMGSIRAIFNAVTKLYKEVED